MANTPQIPRTLKGYAVYMDGELWAGKVTKGEMPELAQKLEEHRGAGMIVPVDIPLGWENSLKVKMTLVDPAPELIAKAYGDLDSIQLVFRSHHENDMGSTDTLIVTCRGALRTPNLMEMAEGEMGEIELEYSLVYFKFEYAGKRILEIDALNSQVWVGDRHLTANRSKSLGLSW